MADSCGAVIGLSLLRRMFTDADDLEIDPCSRERHEDGVHEVLFNGMWLVWSYGPNHVAWCSHQSGIQAQRKVVRDARDHQALVRWEERTGRARG